MSHLAVVILAAGQSTRMKSGLSKVLHPLAGLPVISYPIAAARALKAREVLVVRGPDQQDLKKYLRANGIRDVVQKKPMGTANAVQAAESALSSFKGDVLILCGDVPLVRPEPLLSFVEAVRSKRAVIGVLSMTLRDPAGYGRIVRDLDGRMIRIVEHRDATDEEKRICEVNSGIICAERSWLFKTLKRVKTENSKGEFYLTDLAGFALKDGLGCVAFNSGSSEDYLGINTRIDLAQAAEIVRGRINKRHMLNGVGILDWKNVWVDEGVKIGADTTIMPYSFILGKTVIGNNCVIENGVVLRDAIVGDGVNIKAHSVVEESQVGDDANVGPFARLRPGSKMGRASKVGNFVELKKCELKDGAKASHLSYLGDATVGKKANVGCGTITCNYDGRAKHRTVIGEGAFIGSDVQFVAPVKIGRGSVIGAGSTITKDVPADALALSRVEQVNVKNWAKKKR